ncbi:MAG: hypothetical protein KF862_14660 [Chitinophagaceae bacterium]|nr:hypothetical protein [Chitinophagaceae bacterium]
MITNLRKIAFHIRGMHSFWILKDLNVKSVIDSKYKNLTYERYRGEDSSKRPYEEFEKIDQDIGGITGQGYLALKGLENDDKVIYFFTDFSINNYTLNELQRFRKYTQSFHYFLDQSDDKIVNFNSVNGYNLRFIDELYATIRGSQIDRTNYKKSIKDLFSHFESHVFDRVEYLTYLNSDLFPRTLKLSFINMLVFLGILIATIFVMLIPFLQKTDLVLSLVIVSLFIANTVDLILITYISITKELNIEEVHEV